MDKLSLFVCAATQPKQLDLNIIDTNAAASSAPPPNFGWQDV